MTDHTRSPSMRDARERSTVLEGLNTHSSGLLSHLQLVKSVTADLTPQKASQILTSARKLLDDFATLKSQLIANGVESNSEQQRVRAKAPRLPNKTNSKNANVEAANSGIASGSANLGGSSKKRSWDNDFSETPESTMGLTASQSSRKRLRTTREIQGENDAVDDFVPVALQKDDISEEVDRRLRLKEERRKQLSAEPEKKRKRDSTSSNNGSTKGRTKRSRELNTDGVL